MSEKMPEEPHVHGNKELKYRVAVHEVGHALCFHAMFPLVGFEIEPNPQSESGKDGEFRPLYVNADLLVPVSLDAVRRRMIYLLGGIAAEFYVFEVVDGIRAQRDLTEFSYFAGLYSQLTQNAKYNSDPEDMIAAGWSGKQLQAVLDQFQGEAFNIIAPQFNLLKCAVSFLQANGHFTLADLQGLQ